MEKFIPIPANQEMGALEVTNAPIPVKACIPPCSGNTYCDSETGKCKAIAVEEKAKPLKVSPVKGKRVRELSPHSGTVYTLMDKNGTPDRDQMEYYKSFNFSQ